MMDLTRVHRIYFLGIGGIGMSALARYFLWLGKEVKGYDRTRTPLTLQLEKEGIEVNYTDEQGNVSENTELVIYTPAVPQNSRQMQYVINRGIPMYKRAHILGMITQKMSVIAVAGTHGKTTVTSILSHIFKTAGMEFIAFPGGISTNYDTNFIANGEPHWAIVEADEYDRSFLHLHPDIAVITSMDADHLDIYGSLDSIEESFRLFAGNMNAGGSLITKNTIPELKEISSRQQYYGLTGASDFSIEQIEITNGKYSCRMKHKGQSMNIVFGGAGKHNLENALAAVAAATLAGVDWSQIRLALGSYKGVKRRFEILLHTDNIIYIDDYAHHPEEIRSCINSVLEMFPGKKITGIFQPHLYSRTRDFAVEFGQALDVLDQVVVMDIYPARELPIPGVTAQSILEHVHNAKKIFLPDNKIMDFVSCNTFDVLITMGAGNIDKFVQPIKEKLEQC